MENSATPTVRLKYGRLICGLRATWILLGIVFESTVSLRTTVSRLLTWWKNSAKNAMLGSGMMLREADRLISTESVVGYLNDLC